MDKTIYCAVKDYQIRHYTDIESTNNTATELALSGVAEGAVVFADFQTAGRGQRQNAWESERGKNLTFSLVLHPQFLLAEQQFLLLKTISVAVCNYLKDIGIDAQIKWPNDIYVDDKKITGMLIEHSIMGEYISFSVIGIGLNLNQEKFTSNAPNPVSVFQILGHEIDRVDALNQLLSHIDKQYLILKNGDMQAVDDAYFNLLYRRNGVHLYKDCNGVFKARISAILPTGELELEDEHGTLLHFAFKEVSFVLPSM